MKNDIQVIRAALLKTLSRWRLVAGWRTAWLALFIASLAWLTVLLTYKVLPLPESVLGWAGLIALALLPLGFLIGFLKAPSLMETARWVDQHHHSKEKLSTALEWTEQKKDDDWNRTLLKEASKCAQDLNPRHLLPYRLPKLSRWILLTLAAGFGLGFVPEYRSKDFKDKQAAAPYMKEAGRELEALSRKSLKEPPRLESTQEILEDLEKLGSELRNVKLNRDQALQKIASAAERIREETRKLNDDPAMKKMKELARSRSAANNTGNQSEQNNPSPSLNSPGKNGTNPDALESLRKKLDSLMAQAQEAAQSGNPMSQKELSNMMDAMSALSQEALDLGADLDSLDAAFSALKSGEVDRFLQNLEMASLDLEKMIEMAKQFKEMQAQSQKTGEDLAEQLEFGQMSQAAARLNKMAAKLDTRSLTEQEKEALLQELQKALDPADKYPDELSDLLQQAMAEMKSGKNPQAAGSLQKAAELLKELDQQMQNADSLAECLNGLKTASMCIGNGMSWSQCQSQYGSFGNKKGGGAGVGTWADEGIEIDPASIVQQRVDNSGIKQGTLDPKGVSDRGEGKAPEGMIPDKLRGRMTPGGPMPSITLKGVSVRGQSRVEYQESVISAQDAAQSALNQDEVPKAYRNAVRNYFDDL